MKVAAVLFGATGLVPHQRAAQVVGQGFAWNHTTFLNVALLVLAGVLLGRAGQAAPH